LQEHKICSQFPPVVSLHRWTAEPGAVNLRTRMVAGLGINVWHFLVPSGS